MMVRSWRGATRAADTEAYLAYLRQTGLAAYAATPGHRGTLTLTRTEADRTEFLLLSFWQDMDSIRRFAGAEPGRAVFYPEDDRFLVDRDLAVSHWQLRDGSLPG